ncbi:MAG TPA: flagellar filament capping protein FliD [Candidatus Saccharimonadales bacterium]|nr:flagellar filament capping protein FliD [Candidatus Saccharimonadales bacterium]
MTTTSSTSGTALIQGTSYTSGAGIDVTSTVDAIIAQKQIPETAWKNDQATISAQQTALGTLRTEIGSLETSFQDLHDFFGVFSGLNATSSNSSVVTATTTTGASSGAHKITVANLASTGVSYSNAQTSATSAITAGALVFQIGDGAAQTINIPGDTVTASDGTTSISSTTTLKAEAAYINQQSDLGIKATIVTDSLGARLSLTSTASGAAGSVSVLSAPDGQTFSNIAGVDAKLTVDGVPLVSSSNKLSTAIPGVTLNLTGVSTSETELDISPDTEKITAAVNSFITSYNAAITDLQNQFQYSAGATAGVLETDPAARQIQAQLLSAISVVTDGNATFKTLGSLGISMGNDGTLSLDSSKFASALNDNFSDVQSFFQSTDSSSFAQSFTSLMDEMTDLSKSPIVLDLNSLKAIYANDQKNIDDLEANLVITRAALVAKYSSLDALLKTIPSQMDQINTLLGYKTTNSSS